MLSNSYKFEEWKITESPGGELYWESHYGFGGSLQGKCLRKGRLLFFMPHENQDVGFLKGEFLENLDKLPVWSKSDYHCRQSRILHCADGAMVGPGEMLSWHRQSQRADHAKPPASGPTPGTPQNPTPDGQYRLADWEVTVREGSLSCLRAGRTGDLECYEAVLLEDILFLRRISSSCQPPDFASWKQKLALLPAWELSQYYCPGARPIPCRPVPSRQAPEPRRPRAWKATARPGPGAGAVFGLVRQVGEYLRSRQFRLRGEQAARVAKAALRLAVRALAALGRALATVAALGWKRLQSRYRGRFG